MSFTAQHRGGAGEPLLLLHGFTDTWRTWELVLPALEARHDVLAPTLAGHAGGPASEGRVDDDALADHVEAAMDAAGWETAHVVGNSLGGFVGLQLAARGRARSVVAFAPAGGWAVDDRSAHETLDHFVMLKAALNLTGVRAEEIVASDEGRRRATLMTTVNYAHLEPDLLAHQIRGVMACEGVVDAVEHAKAHGWQLDAARVTVPVRIVWGTADKLLRWPAAAARFRGEWLPEADWVVLDDVGHCPQLDVPEEAARLVLDWTGRSSR